MCKKKAQCSEKQISLDVMPVTTGPILKGHYVESQGTTLESLQDSSLMFL